jgi:hypothetical protein
MMRRLRRFLALCASERRLFIGAWLALPIIDVSLRVFGLESTRRALDRLSPVASLSAAQQQCGQGVPSDALIAAEQAASVIALAGRHALANGSCLRQALLLGWLLRRRGLLPELHIGVCTRGGFAAHAWVELGGRHLAQGPEQQARFVRLEQFNARHRVGT